MTTFTNFAVLIALSCVANIFAQVPYINPRDYPVPGQLFHPTFTGDAVVTLHRYTYTPAGYDIHTEWYRDEFHKANGSVQVVDDQHFYAEEGFYVKAQPGAPFLKVDYKVDREGFEELQRTEVEIAIRTISLKAIRGILG